MRADAFRDRDPDGPDGVDNQAVPEESNPPFLLDDPETLLSQDRLHALAFVPDEVIRFGRLEAVLFSELRGFVENITLRSKSGAPRGLPFAVPMQPERGEAYRALLEQRTRLFGELRALLQRASQGTLPLLRDCALDAISRVIEQRISERLTRKIFSR